MSGRAHIAHAVPGRLRIKVPAMRGDIGFFARAEQQLARMEGVRQASSNARTASILLEHSGVTVDAVRELAQREDLFTLTGDPVAVRRATTVWEVASSGVGSVDEVLKAVSSGMLDVRSVLFVGLLAMSVRQLNKGYLMGPAATLFWYALQLLNTPWKGRSG